MNGDDGIEARVTCYANVVRQPPRIRIGDVVFEFPPGTTDEEAQSVLDESKRVYFAERAAEGNDDEHGHG